MKKVIFGVGCMITGAITLLAVDPLGSVVYLAAGVLLFIIGFILGIIGLIMKD